MSPETPNGTFTTVPHTFLFGDGGEWGTVNPKRPPVHVVRMIMAVVRMTFFLKLIMSITHKKNNSNNNNTTIATTTIIILITIIVTTITTTIITQLLLLLQQKIQYYPNQNQYQKRNGE